MRINGQFLKSSISSFKETDVLISQGNYGKRLLHIPEAIKRDYNLSEHLAIDVLHKMKRKKKSKVSEFADQMIISYKFRNAMRMGDVFYLWE